MTDHAASPPWRDDVLNTPLLYSPSQGLDMTSMSFGPRDPGPQPASDPPPGGDVSPPGKNREQGAEARRVKNFTGQHTFHVPAADDFIKGMLPDGQMPATEACVLRRFCAAIGSMVGAIKGLWQQATPTSRGPGKAD